MFTNHMWLTKHFSFLNQIALNLPEKYAEKIAPGYQSFRKVRSAPLSPPEGNQNCSPTISNARLGSTRSRLAERRDSTKQTMAGIPCLICCSSRMTRKGIRFRA